MVLRICSFMLSYGDAQCSLRWIVSTPGLLSRKCHCLCKYNKHNSRTISARICNSLNLFSKEACVPTNRTRTICRRSSLGCGQRVISSSSQSFHKEGVANTSSFVISCSPKICTFTSILQISYEEQTQRRYNNNAGVNIKTPSKQILGWSCYQEQVLRRYDKDSGISLVLCM